MQEFLDVAVRLAREAGAILRGNLDQLSSVRKKGSDIDLVTESDVASERIISAAIREAFPEHAILAEEGGALGNPEGAYKWIVDPLDGTTNYAHGLRVFCVCIGLEVAGVPALGCVYDPMAEEMFTGYTGGGAFLNGHPIRVSETTELSQAMVATGFAYDVRTNPDDNLGRFCAFIKRARAVRRLGSAGLDLCYTACGRFDGFWETYLSPWDLCAGVAIAREAGAKVTDFAGAPHSIYAGTHLISNGRIHDEMVQVIRAASEHAP